MSDCSNLSEIVDDALRGELDLSDPQTALPRLAREPRLTGRVREAIRQLPTSHTLWLRDAREMENVPDESVQLVLTSPPYWTLKPYPANRAQLGSIPDYDAFLDELDRVWKHCHRALVEGGRLIIVVGDVCLARKKAGRHAVVPLHASIQERCRGLGLDNLAPIIWYKITNAALEVENGAGSFLGKPYEPNAIVKNDIEYILMQRKPGGYRNPSLATRILSVIAEADHRAWFRQIWDLPGAPTRGHPAPYPLELAERLVRMFSFVGDTVLDPFMGTGTTNLAASLWGRNSIGFEIDPTFFEMARGRLAEKHSGFFSQATVTIAV